MSVMNMDWLIHYGSPYEMLQAGASLACKHIAKEYSLLKLSIFFLDNRINRKRLIRSIFICMNV
jgi:hypothetical protein